METNNAETSQSKSATSDQQLTAQNQELLEQKTVLREQLSRRGFLQKGAAVIGANAIAIAGIEGGVIKREEDINNLLRIENFQNVMVTIENALVQTSPKLTSALAHLDGSYGDEYAKDLATTVLDKQFRTRQERFVGVYHKAVTAIERRSAGLTTDEKEKLALITAYAGSAWDKEDTDQTTTYLGPIDAVAPTLQWLPINSYDGVTAISATYHGKKLSGKPIDVTLALLEEAKPLVQK